MAKATVNYDLRRPLRWTVSVRWERIARVDDNIYSSQTCVNKQALFVANGPRRSWQTGLINRQSKPLAIKVIESGFELLLLQAISKT